MRLSEFADTTPVLISTVEQPIEMSVADVLRWVAPTAPPSEAFKFLMVCRMAQVNPLLGEAHLVDHGGRFTTIIDKSGYLKRAQAHPAYEGHEAGIIAQEFDPVAKARGRLTDLPGSFLPPGYIVVGGWAKVHRNGVKRPIEARVSIQEYNRNSATWKTLTCTMIRKVALVQALRESGLITTGWYASGEVGEPGRSVPEPDDFDASTGIIEAEYEQTPDSALSADMAARLVGLMDAVGMTADQRLSALQKRGVLKVGDLTDTQAYELVIKLQQIVDGRTMGQRLLPDPEPTIESPVVAEDQQHEGESESESESKDVEPGGERAPEGDSEVIDATIED